MEVRNMKNAAGKNNKKILSQTSKMFILMFVLIAIAIVTPVAYASKDNKSDDKQSRDRITMFDPFAIKTFNIEGTNLISTDNSNPSNTNTLTLKTTSFVNRLQIRIPFRPIARSPFKPTYLNL
jgi:hypothetical protein